jgi:hypothetical protein
LTARSSWLFRTLEFISAVLGIPSIKANMGGVRSRVATWFCFFDAKSSLFQARQPAGGLSVIDAIGSEQGLVDALHASRNILNDEYSAIYPKEGLKHDQDQLPLLEIMLRLMALLHRMSRYDASVDWDEMDSVRSSLDDYKMVSFYLDIFVCFNPHRFISARSTPKLRGPFWSSLISNS